MECCGWRFKWQTDKMLMPISIVLGVLTGVLIPGNAELPSSYRPVSSIMGWVYFYMWAISFYPQAITNYNNKSTKGFNTDKILYDMVGFGALSLYECFMYFVPEVRREYEKAYAGNVPEVDINDVFFATHSLAVTIFIAGQMFYYDGTSNFPSEHSQAIAGVLTAIAVIGFGSVMLLGGHPHTIYTLLNWLYLLSMVKVMITILKFLPQVRSNIARKSTQGWNIHGSNMDFVGAVLSILQLCLDCYHLHDWSGIEGDFVKLGLGVISGGYDATFAIQHYFIYPNTGDDYLNEQAELQAAAEGDNNTPGRGPSKASRKGKFGQRGIELRYNPLQRDQSDAEGDDLNLDEDVDEQDEDQLSVTDQNMLSIIGKAVGGSGSRSGSSSGDAEEDDVDASYNVDGAHRDDLV